MAIRFQNNPSPGDDPAGVGRSVRGLQSYWDYQTQHPQMADGSGIGYIPTVHPSSQWEGFFQALQDNGANHVAGEEVTLPTDPHQTHAEHDPFGALPSTYDPSFQESASASAIGNRWASGTDGQQSTTGAASGEGLPSATGEPHYHPPIPSQPGINPMAVKGLQKAMPRKQNPAAGTVPMGGQQ